MKLISCDVIEDLIPLYVEDMLSEDSKKLVDTHLDECTECRIYLKELQTMNEVPIESDMKPLKNIEKTITKKKWYAIIIAVLTTLLIGTLTVIFMTSPKYLPYSDNMITVNEGENELISVDFNWEVAGYDINTYQSENGAGNTYHMTTWTTTWHELTNIEESDSIVLNPNGERVESVYYYQTNGTEDILIYGANQHGNGGVVTLPRLSLNYYFTVAVIGLVIGLIAMFIVRSNILYLERITKITMLPLSYIIAQIIVVGLSATTYSLVRDFTAILLVAILLYGLMLIGLGFIKRYLIEKMRQ